MISACAPGASGCLTSLSTQLPLCMLSRCPLGVVPKKMIDKKEFPESWGVSSNTCWSVELIPFLLWVLDKYRQNSDSSNCYADTIMRAGSLTKSPFFFLNTDLLKIKKKMTVWSMTLIAEWSWAGSDSDVGGGDSAGPEPEAEGGRGLDRLCLTQCHGRGCHHQQQQQQCAEHMGKGVW